MAWPTPPSSRPGRSGTWWWLATAPANCSRSRPRRSTWERHDPSLPTPRPSRSDSPAVRGGWLGYRRGRQPEVFVESVEDGADAALVRLVGGRAVEGEGDGQPLLGIGEAGRRAVAAVAEGPRRGVVAIAVRDGGAVLAGVDDEAEPPVENVLEGVVQHAGAVARGRRLDRLRREDAGAGAGTGARSPPARQQHLVEAAELRDRAVAVAARMRARAPGLAVPALRPGRAAGRPLGVVDRAQPLLLAELAVALDRHPDPAVEHAEGLEDLRAHVAAERAAVEPAHHLAEQEPARGMVIAGLAAGHPAWLGPHGGDPGDDRVPAVLGPADVEQANARGVGEQVPQGDRALAVGRELRDVAGHRVVELEPAALPQLGDGDRGHRLAGRQPEHQVVAAQGLAGAAGGPGAVGDRLALAGDIELRAEMEALAHAGENGLAGAGEPRESRVGVCEIVEVLGGHGMGGRRRPAERLPGARIMHQPAVLACGPPVAAGRRGGIRGSGSAS